MHKGAYSLRTVILKVISSDKD